MLTQAGIPDAARDARILLENCLGLDRGRLTLHLDDTIGKDAYLRFFQLLGQREKNIPVSKIIEARSFYGRTFFVNEHVLDPRPDTETLVAAALAEPFNDVLDLGTGSGAIIVTLLAEREATIGIATDVSAQALVVAERNAQTHGTTGRMGFEVSNWFAGVGGIFDLIVSNPPYIASDEMEHLQPEVRDHEPRIALTDEADGLTHYRHIIAEHDPYLRPGGRLMVEIGPTQAQAVSEMMQAVGLTEITVIPDLDGRDRVVWGRKPLKSV